MVSLQDLPSWVITQPERRSSCRLISNSCRSSFQLEAARRTNGKSRPAQLTRPVTLSVSIIIPTLNEERNIGPVLDNVLPLGAAEVIVADGGSSDRTVELARRRARVVACKPGRGVQLNAGAAAATGDVLLFLHADVRLEAGALDSIRSAAARPEVVGGNFDIRYDGGDFTAFAFTTINRWRRRLGILYGDSGIFCRRTVFEELGGFPPYRVLEDYEFVQRLRRRGKLALLEDPIHVSDRRWRQAGLFPTMWAWFWVQGLYCAGVKSERLADWYYDVREQDRKTDAPPTPRQDMDTEPVAPRRID